MEIELIGCDTELDGDEGKEGSRMTPGICPTDTLIPVQNAASSRLWFFFFPLSVVCDRKAWEKASKRDCLNNYGISIQWNAVEPE